MKTPLQSDKENRHEILHRVLSVAKKYFADEGERPPGVFIPDVPMDQLPHHGRGALDTLEFFEKEYAPHLNNSAGPRYFGFVTGGSTPAAMAGDWLVSTYDQNACGSNDSIAPQIERQTIHYFRQLFGLPDEYSGSFVTGATMSNFVGLALARQWAGERSGINPANDGISGLQLKIFSGTPHSSIFKSLSMLGIGRSALTLVATQADREAVDPNALERLLAGQQGPAIVVANAGTVNTGDFDDLVRIAELKQKYNFWLHVDAAFGGFAACSEKLRHLIKGIDAADSITVDAHKWLNVPYDSAMQFTRHAVLQRAVFQNAGASYLTNPLISNDFLHLTPENSRRWRALPAWFTLRSYGREGYREVVERNCMLAKELGKRIQGNDGFELLSPVRLNIVCFTLSYPNVDFKSVQTFLETVRDEGNVFFTPTVYKDRPAIRAAISNWQTRVDDIDIAFRSLIAARDRLQLSGQLEVSEG